MKRADDGPAGPSRSPDRPLEPSGEASDGRVVEVDPHADLRWEKLVCRHADGLVYHHPAWLATIEAAYGHELVALACEDAEGRLLGVLPLFRSQTVLGGRKLSSLPHTPVAGPLGDEAARAALVAAALERARLRPSSSLELKLPAASLEGIPGVAGVAGDETYVLELPTDPERLRFGNSRNHSRIRWAVNKATKLGVRVRPAETLADLRAWYRLYLETMRRHAVPPRPLRFFLAAWERLRPLGLMRLLLAEQEGSRAGGLLAGSVLLMCGQTVFYAYNGRSERELALRPNDVIQWSAIREAAATGYSRYDLGEVTPSQQGLAEFKSKWGAEPRRLHRYYSPAPSPSGWDWLEQGRPLRRLGEAAWQRLPLPATARLGGLLHRLL